ncbi:MAG TPA: four-carbon acid sugar kinase family protein, partial [bacterium]|nr:four-carbon acid sugar kinase family protein [bacterium]
IQCVEAAMKAGVTAFYKKTDSTLRGNVGAELAALLEATGWQELCFVPALPDAGRITRGGIQYVDGVPLHRSRYAGDAANPVRGASVSAIIASQAGTAVACVPRGADPAGVLAGAPRPVILVFDAETAGDLDGIAVRLAAPGLPRLLAGCSGFASVVPRLLHLGTGAAPELALRPPLLVVCGSLNEVSRSQVGHARAAGIRCWDLGMEATGGAEDDLMRAVVDALRRDGAAVVTAGRLLADSCRAVRRVLQQVHVGTLAAFGGDTAFGILEALGVRGMWPLGEISPGVVASRVDGTMRLVTKAGGFGPPDVIQRIRGTLQGVR